MAPPDDRKRQILCPPGKILGSERSLRSVELSLLQHGMGEATAAKNCGIQPWEQRREPLPLC